jgi:hypothetical protein
MKKAPRLKKVQCSPPILRTWIVRLYCDGKLMGTGAYATHEEAHRVANLWRRPSKRTAEIEVVEQERMLRG